MRTQSLLQSPAHVDEHLRSAGAAILARAEEPGSCQMEARAPGACSATVLVVAGYGAVGRQISHALAQSGIAVIVAGRQADKAASAAGEIGASARRIDLQDPASWERACEGVDCIVMCMDQTDTSFVEFLFQRGIDYVDVTASDAFFRAVEWLMPRRSAAMLSVGLAPGLTNMLAAHCCARLDVANKLEIGLLAGLGDRHGEASLEWMADRLFDPARDRRSEWLDFGLGQGRRKAHPVDFSDQHCLRRTLGIPDTVTRLACESRLATWGLFAVAGMFAGSPLVRKATLGLFRRLRLGSAICGVSVHASGLRNGRPALASAHFAGEGVAAVTAKLASLQIAAFLGRRPPAGVWHCHEILDWEGFAAGLKSGAIGSIAIEPLRIEP